jgi:hypothetical protein
LVAGAAQQVHVWRLEAAAFCVRTIDEIHQEIQ